MGRFLFDGMETKEERTTIGVIIPEDLKEKLLKIAKREHRSLSRQAEFFLRQAVEHLDTDVEQ